MKLFKNMAAQGDLLIRRVQSLPDGIQAVEAVDGTYIVAHSETGHNHVIDQHKSVSLYSNGDPMISYLRVVEATDEVEIVLRHMRDFDTHEPIVVQPGLYEIRRQREYVPSGWRKVED